MTAIDPRRRRTRALCVALVCLPALIWCAPASASKAEVVLTPASGGGQTFSAASERLEVTDPLGEDNSLTATEGASRSEVLIADSQAPLEVGRGCVQVDRHRASCSFSVHMTYVSFDGGTGDDAIDLRSFPRGASYIEGGPGADTIWTSPGGGSADAGPGPDHLIGGAGRNFFTDSGPVDSDVYEGGGGDDTIAYSRTDGITVDLAAGTAGAPSEADRLVGFSTVLGGSGADVLRGSEAADTLDGRYGNDRIDGRGGDDDLEGGAALPRGVYDAIVGGAGDDRIAAAPIGHARMEGGSGDDYLLGGEGMDQAFGGEGADSLALGPRDIVDGGPGDDDLSGGLRPICGPGRDRLGSWDTRTEPADDCERIVVNDGLEADRLVRIRGGHAVLRLYCPRLPNRRYPIRHGCGGTLLFERGSPKRPRRVGSARYSTRRGRSSLVRVKLRKAAIRRFRTTGRLRLSTTIVWRRRDESGYPFYNEAGWSLVVRRPGD